MGCVGTSDTYKEATLGEMLLAPKMMEKCARADLITMTGACGPFGNLRPTGEARKQGEAWNG